MLSESKKNVILVCYFKCITVDKGQIQMELKTNHNALNIVAKPPLDPKLTYILGEVKRLKSTPDTSHPRERKRGSLCSPGFENLNGEPRVSTPRQRTDSGDPQREQSLGGATLPARAMLASPCCLAPQKLSRYVRNRQRWRP